MRQLSGFLLCVFSVFLLPVSAAAQGLGWAPGLLYTANFYGDRETVDIIDQNGMVQTVEEVTSNIQPVVETHALFGGPNVAIGPFVGGTLGDNVFTSVGLGGMLRLRDFQLGVGYWVDPEAKIRRSDFKPGKPAPDGYDEVQYVTKSVGYLAIMVTVKLP